ncbi:PREDICTED: uncharacterized protein LOC109356329 [Lupinus angustifolius]|uniref:uncharacterized protein LOC109356329 n=1 Tax=Lupinus angustifolius TaxID=3871 RepID=UPI00092EA87A|nr:PREDICTED: uncharacterized protein LOC109356329 [Lupinus angustifolius]
MRVLFWNYRGLSNTKTKLVLKNLCLVNKPDLVFLAEPMIAVGDVNNLFWSELQLSVFTLNDRGPRLPNIWGLCKKDLSPSVIVSSSQFMALSLNIDNKLVNLCVVYAHNLYMQRRTLWKDIIDTMSSNSGPWSYIGDFNVVLGSHECRGLRLPSKITSEDFQNFTEDADLIHLNTRGVDFTWTNKRRGASLTEKRLDRVLCNEDWISSWNQVLCCTLPRISSDHNPILFCSLDSDARRSSYFRFLKMWTSHPDCIRVIADAWKEDILGCPMFILAEKLKRLKCKLNIWNWNVFGNIHQQVKEALSSVDVIQACINDHGPTIDLLN